jgi:hypothetical protein
VDCYLDQTFGIGREDVESVIDVEVLIVNSISLNQWGRGHTTVVLEYRDTSSGVSLIVARLCLYRQFLVVYDHRMTCPVATTGGRVIFTPEDAQRAGVLLSVRHSSHRRHTKLQQRSTISNCSKIYDQTYQNNIPPNNLPILQNNPLHPLSLFL